MEPQVDLDRLRKIAAGSGGIPVKRFVEDPDTFDPWAHYAQLLKHHETETTLLYQMLQALAGQIVEAHDEYRRIIWSPPDLNYVSNTDFSQRRCDFFEQVDRIFNLNGSAWDEVRKQAGLVSATD